MKETKEFLKIAFCVLAMVAIACLVFYAYSCFVDPESPRILASYYWGGVK